jgi:predicted amidohydrolase
VQLQVTPSKEENLRNVIDSLYSGLEICDLVVFPEYCMGYPNGPLTRKFVRDIAEPLDGEFVKRVAEKGKAKQLTLVLPILEKAGATVFNTAVIIANGKVVGGYRKIKLFDALGYRESGFFGAGSELVLFKVRDTPVGVITCYELRFPELMKREAMAGARAVIVPAGWVRGPMKEMQWEMLLTARATENTSYVIGVGNAHEAFIGRSMVIDPFGVKVLDLGYGNRVREYEIDDSVVADAREKAPVLQQSRHLSGIKCRRL